MPPSPLQRCASPGCPNTIVADDTTEHCLQHRRIRRRHNGWNYVYGKDWRRIRFEFLVRHPICVLCGRLAKVPDHYPIGIRELKRMRHPDPHADENMRALCHSCHGRATALETGGWDRGL